MTGEVLQSLVGALVSVLFSYIPGLSDWFYKFDSNKQRLIMFGVLIVVSVGLFGLSCAGYADKLGLPVMECSQQGGFNLLKILITVLIANQATYALSPRTTRNG